jgi:hypothetical protein
MITIVTGKRLTKLRIDIYQQKENLIAEAVKKPELPRLMLVRQEKGRNRIVPMGSVDMLRGSPKYTLAHDRPSRSPARLLFRMNQTAEQMPYWR